MITVDLRYPLKTRRLNLSSNGNCQVKKRTVQYTIVDCLASLDSAYMSQKKLEIRLFDLIHIKSFFMCNNEEKRFFQLVKLPF